MLSKPLFIFYNELLVNNINFLITFFLLSLFLIIKYIINIF